MAPSSLATMRAQRSEDVRQRVEAAVGRSLQPVGRDYVLPDGRRVVICYSKLHRDRAGFYLGLPNRLQKEDILILLLNDKHLVFPRAEFLLRYRDDWPKSGNGRPIPGLQLKDGKFVLRIASIGLTVELDDRIDAYRELIHSPARPRVDPVRFGRRFRKANEEAAPLPPAPGSADPDKTIRGVRAHARTLNALAAHLECFGIQPLEVDQHDLPQFDLAWIIKDHLFVAEVKSITEENEGHQLRLGLGQLLFYCHLLRHQALRIIPVLVPEREPFEPEWASLCQSYGIKLIFPPNFEGLRDSREVNRKEIIPG
jgi:hypothetical protein